MPPIVEMKGIVKQFPGVHALSGVDFTLHPGEIHALLGENGAGKSTLMKVLGGLYRPNGGEIRIGGQPVSIDAPGKATELGIGFIHQELNLAGDLTVAENIFLGRLPTKGPFRRVDWAAMRRGARTVLDRLGTPINPDTLVGDLSVGNRQMVEIAKALSLNARVLIMDEPTAALTEAESERLATVVRSLAADGVAIVYISHRLEEIFRLCQSVTILRDGHLVGSCKVADVSPDRLITMMVGRELTERFPKVEVSPGDVLLAVSGLSRTGVFQDVSFTLRTGEILGVAGLMGAGRSEVMRAVAGIDRCSSGLVKLGGTVLRAGDPAAAIGQGLVLVPEDRKKQGLLTGRSVRENASLAVLRNLTSAGMIRGEQERTLVDRFIGDLGIRTPHREQSVNLLSGGNQQKVILARWLATNPRVLILDEPTRGIDVGAKAEIYKLMGRLVQQGMGIIVVSSELPEVLGLSDRILVMHQGRLTGEFRRGEADQEQIMRAATGRNEHAG
ncbi:MAG TPA: sugar ABC transporter ATP-binding protein [Symbiobacteriaceae bacterium]|nr:sugar ABC transporter ATP-binding protein [Symbiobacteriaceae bacterium]